MTEPESSDLIEGKSKWVKGIRWSDIDERLVLTVGKIQIDLNGAPMVLEELSRVSYPLPQTGPVIVNELTARPYADYQFRVEWRATADAAGLPTVQNMHSHRPTPPSGQPSPSQPPPTRQRFSLWRDPAQ